MIFNLLAAFAVIHIMLEPPQGISRQKPQAILIYFRPGLKIFAAFAVLYFAALLVRRFLPQAGEFMPAAAVLLAYAAGKSVKLSEPLQWMVLALWALLVSEPPAAALFQAALAAFGVSLTAWTAAGIRFRLLLTPAAPRLASTPGLLALLALILLVLSSFFTAAT
jgi:hypothetical protein